MRKLVGSFEGRPLTTITYRGRPAWLARDIGRALEYSDDGKRLVHAVTTEWGEELVAGTDYERVEGGDLRDLKRALGAAELTTESVVSGALDERAPSAILLYESGVHLVCLKTEKPVGRRLRRWLATEVLPQLAREGSFGPRARGPSDEREARLRRALELRERRQTGRAMRAAAQLALSAGLIDEATFTRRLLAAAEHEAGPRGRGLGSGPAAARPAAGAPAEEAAPSAPSAPAGPFPPAALAPGLDAPSPAPASAPPPGVPPGAAPVGDALEAFEAAAHAELGRLTNPALRAGVRVSLLAREGRSYLDGARDVARRLAAEPAESTAIAAAHRRWEARLAADVIAAADAARPAGEGDRA